MFFACVRAQCSFSLLGKKGESHTSAHMYVIIRKMVFLGVQLLFYAHVLVYHQFSPV
jgi:hypothetical protein